MAEILVQGTGHTLSWSDYVALDAATQQALYVGGGSMDYNDWLLPFVLHVIVTKVQGGQHEILTLTASDFTVSYLTGRARKPCQILYVGTPSPRRRIGQKVIAAVAPPHTQDDIAGPEWFLSVTAKQGQLISQPELVKVIDVN